MDCIKCTKINNVKVLNKDNINKHLCDNCKPINLYEERNLIYEFRKYNKRLLNDKK